jgi:2-iminobutanoate/2-iminopropanoate deaminase
VLIADSPTARPAATDQPGLSWLRRGDQRGRLGLLDPLEPAALGIQKNPLPPTTLFFHLRLNDKSYNRPATGPMWQSEHMAAQDSGAGATLIGETSGMGDEVAMAVKIERIQPAGMNVRMQQGKPAYSHVVTVTGPGRMIYIAGQLARDADGKIVGPGDMRSQLEQTFKNLDACLKAAGATWADVVKTNTFVTDYQAFSQCSDVRMRYFGVGSPTSTTIQISGLAQPEAMVEIEMIAAVD